MNISRSRAVDNFKKYGIFWYYSAQKLPIDIYKDIILFHEFIENIEQLIHTHYHTQSHLITIVQDRHEAYKSQNYDHPIYGGFIEVMIRRRIGAEYVKSFLQSMLLHTTHIDYQDEDQIEAYIYGSAESLWIMISEIVGCAPAGQSHVKSLSEWIWFVHMLLDLPHDRHDGKQYIPRSTLTKYQVSPEDISKAIRTGRPSEPVRVLIKHYVDLHESMWAYAIKWLWYLNNNWHEALLLMLSDYEQIVDIIKRYNYNIFHPRFNTTIGGKIWWYLMYRFYSLIWTN